LSMRRKYTLLIGSLLLAGFGAYLAIGLADTDRRVGPVERLFIDLASPNIAATAFVGDSEAMIVREWGRPSKEWVGHYGCPPDDYVKQNSPARTLVFQRWTGALYVSVKQQPNGEWICFSSTWLPKGAEF
jgi:hypothetical protein